MVAILRATSGYWMRCLEIIEKSRQNPLQKLIAISADVTDAKAIALTLADLKTNHGLPDLLINCAGVAKPGYAELLPLEDFRWMMDIDYHGTVNVTQTLLPDFIARGSGHIVNFSSLAGAVGIFGYTAYCGAKFAVRGYSDALRSEMKPRGIRVSCVFPPDTDTPQLAQENQFKPFETHVIAGSDKPLPAEKVAKAFCAASKRQDFHRSWYGSQATILCRNASGRFGIPCAGFDGQKRCQKESVRTSCQN